MYKRQEEYSSVVSSTLPAEKEAVVLEGEEEMEGVWLEVVGKVFVR